MSRSEPVLLALVGDRSASVAAHGRIPLALDALGRRHSWEIEADWRHSTSIDGSTDMGVYDGIWVLPGSPYADVGGVLLAISAARTGSIPFLGTCGGFQHMLLEYARDVAGLDVDHAESTPGEGSFLLVPLTCSLLGEVDSLTVLEGTRAAEILGSGRRTERYFCSYGPDSAYVPALEAAGLVVGARDDHGEVRMAELADHPFFVGSLFQPELASDAEDVHPLIEAFVLAAHERVLSRSVGA